MPKKKILDIRQLLSPRSRSESRGRDRSPARPDRAASEDRTLNPAPTSAPTPFGLHCLTPDLDDDQLSQSPLDIVAIHGINGDAYKTWSHGDTLWLRDFLPEQVPGARVFSFRYDAQVAFSSSRADIRDFARSLLNSLKTSGRGKVCLLKFAHSVR
jgi:hypothetical protein